jgi:hypothetical protein
MLTYWSDCLFLNLGGKAASILPPEVVTLLQDHHATVVCVPSFVVGSVRAPEGVAKVLATVRPCPMSFIAYNNTYSKLTSPDLKVPSGQMRSA